MLKIVQRFNSERGTLIWDIFPTLNFPDKVLNAEGKGLLNLVEFARILAGVIPSAELGNIVKKLHDDVSLIEQQVTALPNARCMSYKANC